MASDRLENWLNRHVAPSWYARSLGPLLCHPLVASADVIHIHNVQWPNRNLSYRLLRALSRRAPLLWTMHDMWPVTGHCMVARECTRWQTGCGACPDLAVAESIAYDLTARAWAWKQATYAASSFTLIHPSSWSEGIAAASPLMTGKLRRIIPNPVSSGLTLIERSVARRALNLDPEVPVLLFASNWLGNPYKGATQVMEILARVQATYPKVCLLTMGPGRLPGTPPVGLCVVPLGHVGSDWGKSLAFSAADVLLNPSLGDSFSLITAEALACGTPVAAYATGGIPDVICEAQLGRTVTTGDRVALAAAVIDLLSREHDRAALRSSLLSRSGIEVVVAAHRKVYAEALRLPLS